MRIAYICADPGIPVFGCKGCSLHIQEIIRSFQRLNIEVVVFATNLGGEAAEDLKNITAHQLPSRRKIDSKPDRAQREQIAIESYHWFMWKLLQDQPFDLVYERYSLWGRAGVDFAAKKEIPSLLEVNAPLIEEAKNYRGLINESQALSIAQHNFQHASLVCCVSQTIADYVESFSGNITGKVPVLVTPNAVNPDRFTSLSLDEITQKNQRTASDPLTIGFVGTLKPWHGLENLLKAFATFVEKRPQVQSSLLIVGDGPQREAMETLAKDLNIINQLQFVGAVAPATIPYWMRKMDIAVAPYPALENFYFSPLKVFEYMAAGIPVIASDIGQIKELFEHKKQAVLVEPGSISALVNALDQIYLEPQSVLTMVQQAQQHILRHYTWDAVAEAMLKQLAKQKRSSISLHNVAFKEGS